MSDEERRSNSFVVRIWWEHPRKQLEGEQLLWRGWIQHAFTDRFRYFRSIGEMLSFIQEYTGSLSGETRTDEEEI